MITVIVTFVVGVVVGAFGHLTLFIRGTLTDKAYALKMVEAILEYHGE